MLGATTPHAEPNLSIPSRLFVLKKKKKRRDPEKVENFHRFKNEGFSEFDHRINLHYL